MSKTTRPPGAGARRGKARHHAAQQPGLKEYIPFRRPSDVLPLYEDAIAADAELIDTSTRWYWGLNALDHLASCRREDEATIAKMKLTAWCRINGHLYRLALLP